MEQISGTGHSAEKCGVKVEALLYSNTRIGRVNKQLLTSSYIGLRPNGDLLRAIHRQYRPIVNFTVMLCTLRGIISDLL